MCALSRTRIALGIVPPEAYVCLQLVASNGCRFGWDWYTAGRRPRVKDDNLFQSLWHSSKSLS